MFGPARSSRMFPSSFKQESPYFLPLESGGLSLPSCLTNHGSGDILWFLMLGYKARRGPALVSPLGLCGFGALYHHKGKTACTDYTERERDRDRARGEPQRVQPADGWAFRAHGDSSPSPLTAFEVWARTTQLSPEWSRDYCLRY